LGPGVEAELDIARSTLRHPPIDDADHLAPPRALGGQADLPAGVGGGLKHHDLVTALSGNARGLQPGGAGADDGDPFSYGGGRDIMWHAQLTSRRGVVDAQRISRLIN